MNGALVAPDDLDLSTIAILPTDTLTRVVTAEDAFGESASDSVDVTIQTNPLLSSVGLTFYCADGCRYLDVHSGG